MANKQEFVYQSRSKDQLKKRADQKSSIYDKPYAEGIKILVAKAGDHRIRIMPPTWDNADHYGIDAWYHSGIGPDQQTYLCALKMGRGNCPVCDEAKTIRGTDKAAEEQKRQLKPYRRVLVWAIDRNAEAEGPMLYPMPWTIDKDISAMSIDKDSGEILQIDHPTQGYDIQFGKEGSGLNTQYTGTMIARRSTPLSTDARAMSSWLNYIQKTPIDSVLVFYDYDHIQRAFDGGVVTKTDAPAVTTRNQTAEVVEEPVIEDRRGATTEAIEEVEEAEVVVATTPATTSIRDKVREGLSRIPKR